MNGSFEFSQLAKPIAEDYKIDLKLLTAIAGAESSWRPHAVRYEPKWPYFLNVTGHARRLNISRETEKIMQSCSWGYMQLMGTVCRELGFREPLHKMTNPIANIKYGCLKIRSLQDKYSDLNDVISAYNAGYPKKTNNEYINQHYVNRVLNLL